MYQRILFFCFAFCLSAPAYAWNALGHELIAEIAYQQLTPQVKRRIQLLIPCFKSESTRYRSYRRFSDLARWMDDVKRQGDRLTNRWHYQNRPLYLDGAAPRSGAAFLPHDQSIVPVIIRLIDYFQHSHRRRSCLYARHLARLTHLIGDLHQPLHVANGISMRHPAPEGDRGGNDYAIAFHNKRSLHALVDGGVQLYASVCMEGSLTRQARCLRRRYPVAERETKLRQSIDWSKQIDRWAEQSYQLAHTFYQTPECPPARLHHRRRCAAPSMAYLQQTSILVGQQLVLAGDRLAEALNNLLK